MVDNFSILISHGLLLIAIWVLINRPDLDQEDPPEQDKEPEGFFYQRKNSTKSITTVQSDSNEGDHDA